MTKFERTDNNSRHIGKITISTPHGDVQVSTPLLYPVVNLMTGTTANGGGVWGYVCDVLLQSLSSSHPYWSPLYSNTPFITEALHFLDYNVRPQSLEARWLSQPLRHRYASETRSNHRTSSRGPVSHTSAMFVDSGGFRLLRLPSLVLHEYGLLLEGHEAEGVFSLQQRYGADIIASLDYPFLPTISPGEAQDRADRSLFNAIEAMRLARSVSSTGFNPFVYAACHGLTPEMMSQTVTSLFGQSLELGYDVRRLGVAVGSLVPLRSSKKLEALVALVHAAVEAIPRDVQNFAVSPVHTFGLSGDLVPILVYLGVDSFDSSTFLQQAQIRRYWHPSKRKYVHLRDLSDHKGVLGSLCSCPVCENLLPNDIIASLVSGEAPTLSHDGSHEYKSSWYAKLALHNLYHEQVQVASVRSAVGQSALSEFLIDHAGHQHRIRLALMTSARLRNDWKLISALERLSSRSYHNLPLLPASPLEPAPAPTITYRYTPSSFNICDPDLVERPDLSDLLAQYEPGAQFELALILPCSSVKPYGNSVSQRTTLRTLSAAVGADVMARIHKITLSGLYGPVPVEFETEEEVLRYDFLLSTVDKAQIAENARRVATYLNRWTRQGRYRRGAVAYVPFRAYRDAASRAQALAPGLVITPSVNVRSTSRDEDQLAELIEAVRQCFGDVKGDIVTGVDVPAPYQSMVQAAFDTNASPGPRID